jgi:radical SAM superfamily enzyme YgiQ (UPF0313 family)
MAIIYNFLKDKCVRQIDLNITGNNLNSLYDKETIYQYLCNNIKSKPLSMALSKIVPKFENEIILFSCHSYQQLITGLMIAKHIKETRKNIIVFGGAFFQNCNINYLYESFGFVDIFCQGYIDQIFPSLQKKLIPGLRSVIRSNAAPKFIIPDFSGLDLNNYRLYYDKKYQKVVPIFTSSGCLFKCNFCTGNSVDLNLFNTEMLINVILQMKKHGINTFLFTNQYLNINYNWTKDFCSKLRPLGVKWTSYAHPVNLDLDLIKLMSQSGCLELTFGLESASPSVLKLMNKNYDLNRFSAILQICNANHIEVNLNIIVGYPGESKDDFLQTSTFLNRHAKYIKSVQVSSLSVLYGSPIFNSHQDRLSRTDFFQKLSGRYVLITKNSNKEKSKLREVRSIAFQIIRRRYWFMKIVPFNVYEYLIINNNLYTNNFLYILFQLISALLPIRKYAKK